MGKFRKKPVVIDAGVKTPAQIKHCIHVVRHDLGVDPLPTQSGKT